MTAAVPEASSAPLLPLLISCACSEHWLGVCVYVYGQVEEALTARLEAGRPAETEARDAVAAEIHSSLDWLCRQQTQECVGDAKERLRQRHAAAYAQRKRGAQSAAGLATSRKNGADLSWAAAKEEEQRVTSTKQKRQQPPRRLPWGERQRGGGHWQPLGGGCCGNTHTAIQNGSTLFRSAILPVLRTAHVQTPCCCPSCLTTRA